MNKSDECESQVCLLLICHLTGRCSLNFLNKVWFVQVEPFAPLCPVIQASSVALLCFNFVAVGFYRKCQTDGLMDTPSHSPYISSSFWKKDYFKAWEWQFYPPSHLLLKDYIMFRISHNEVSHSFSNMKTNSSSHHCSCPLFVVIYSPSCW